jgi:cell wall-associated NlpC family hydrolase
MHWATSFIGFEYRRGAQGPLEFDCWSFFRHVQRARFGREVPALPIPNSWRAIAEGIPFWAAQIGLKQTGTPQDGDAVFLARLRDPTHIGIWVGDLRSVLHCCEGGSVLHDARHLAAAQWRVGGYFSPSSFDLEDC